MKRISLHTQTFNPTNTGIYFPCRDKQPPPLLLIFAAFHHVSQPCPPTLPPPPPSTSSSIFFAPAAAVILHASPLVCLLGCYSFSTCHNVSRTRTPAPKLFFIHYLFIFIPTIWTCFAFIKIEAPNTDAFIGNSHVKADLEMNMTFQRTFPGGSICLLDLLVQRLSLGCLWIRVFTLHV